MKTFNILIPVLAICFFAVSCEKNIAGYQEDPRVYFFERSTGSGQIPITYRSYTFLTRPAEVMQDTLLIKVKIMGTAQRYNRVFTAAAVADSSTAVEGIHYDFLEGTIPADSIQGYLPVVVYRTADIADTSVVLKITLAESADFKPGVSSDLSFTLEWSDNVVKPSNWDGFFGISVYFGTYSNAKWRFVVQTVGVSEFPLQQSARVPPQPGEYTSAGMLDVVARVKAALALYNLENDPDLTDEFGQLVTFP